MNFDVQLSVLFVVTLCFGLALGFGLGLYCAMREFAFIIDDHLRRIKELEEEGKRRVDVIMAPEDRP